MGLAMAQSFSAAGMKVVIADIEQQALDAALEQFGERNTEIIGLNVDVTRRDAMEDAARETEEKFGKVHVVCNNAGVAVGGSIDTMTYKDWDWVMGVNLDGVINGVQAFTPRMKAHGEGGHFVNTASMAGHMAVPSLGVYNTSKFAVVGMSEAMRLDLAPHNIGVSVLCPGVVRTNIFDSGRNRPTDLTGERDTAAFLLQGGEGADPSRVEELLAGGLDAAVVGDMVLHAILTDEFYIFSHPEFQPIIEARASEMVASCERWRNYRTTHNIDQE
jgi:NAD(P)-dependent dehydrogenase (short-subunit alcohol dehydrogenase family)